MITFFPKAKHSGRSSFCFPSPSAVSTSLSLSWIGLVRHQHKHIPQTTHWVRGQHRLSLTSESLQVVTSLPSLPVQPSPPLHFLCLCLLLEQRHPHAAARWLFKTVVTMSFPGLAFSDGSPEPLGCRPRSKPQQREPLTLLLFTSPTSRPIYPFPQ